jgi:hypothetical protein
MTGVTVYFAFECEQFEQVLRARCPWIQNAGKMSERLDPKRAPHIDFVIINSLEDLPPGRCIWLSCDFDDASSMKNHASSTFAGIACKGKTNMQVADALGTLLTALLERCAQA